MNYNGRILTGIENVKRKFDIRRSKMGKYSVKANRNIRTRVKPKSVWFLIFEEWWTEDKSQKVQE
jgi:hypothetical protein